MRGRAANGALSFSLEVLALVRRNVLLLLTLAALGAVAGCGGSGAAPASTGVSLRVQWPGRSRLIPVATQSVQVSLRDASGFETFRVLNRPNSGSFSTLVFFGLTPGSLDFAAKAFPSADAQGVAVAAAQSRVTLTPGFQTNVTLDLASTIDRIEVRAQRLDLTVGGAATLTATARDKDGNLVPLTAAKTRWESRDTTIAQVNAAGQVSGVKAGSTLVVFTDDESGKSDSALVVVQ